MFNDRRNSSASLIAVGGMLIGLAVVLLIIKFLMFMAEFAAGIIGIVGLAMIVIGIFFSRRGRDW